MQLQSVGLDHTFCNLPYTQLQNFILTETSNILNFNIYDTQLALTDSRNALFFPTPPPNFWTLKADLCKSVSVTCVPPLYYSNVLGCLRQSVGKKTGRGETNSKPKKMRKHPLLRQGCVLKLKIYFTSCWSISGQKRLSSFTLVSTTATSWKTWEPCHGLSSLWFWKLHALTFPINLTEAGCKHDMTLEKLLFHVYTGTHRAAAPEMISISSLVMTAWRVRLNVKVNLSIISARIN